MEVLTGVASNVQHTTETSGRVSSHSGSVRGSIHTAHVCTMRVANLPVQMRLTGATNLNDGDVVTLIGKRRADGFRGYVLRNETTGTVHAQNPLLVYVAAVCAILVGIPLSLFLIGLPLVGIGAYLLWLAVLQTRAIRLLHASPAPVAEGA